MQQKIAYTQTGSHCKIVNFAYCAPILFLTFPSQLSNKLRPCCLWSLAELLMCLAADNVKHELFPTIRDVCLVGGCLPN